MPSLQFAVMKPGFDNVKCICRDRDGSPAPGQTLILCENCGAWLHQPCIIGLVLNSIPKAGFQCNACVQAQRHEIGKKGVQTKKRNQAKLRGETDYLDDRHESPVPTKKQKDVDWIRQYPLRNPDIQVQEGWVRQYPINPDNPRSKQQEPTPSVTPGHGTHASTSPGLVSTGSLRKLREAREEYKNTVAQSGALTETTSELQEIDMNNNQTDEIIVIPDALEREKAILFVRHRLLKGLLAREKAPEESDMAEINQMITQLEKYDREGYLESDVILSTKIHRVIKAIAQLEGLPAHQYTGLQERCAALWGTWTQRLESVEVSIDVMDNPQTSSIIINDEKPQASSSDEVLCDCPGGHSIINSDTFKCVSCKQRQHKGCIRVAGRRTRQSLVLCNKCRTARTEKQLLETQVNSLNNLQEQESDTLRTYCRTILWKMYCSLPCDEECSDNLRELTHMDHHGGNSTPRHPAPHEWVEEITECIQTMTLLGGDKMNELLGIQSGENQHTRPFAPALREMALWMIHEGPFKFDRHKLGVLSEVLGLEPKGSVWKV